MKIRINNSPGVTVNIVQWGNTEDYYMEGIMDITHQYYKEIQACEAFNLTLQKMIASIEKEQTGGQSLFGLTYSNFMAGRKSRLATDIVIKDIRETLNNCDNKCHQTEIEAICLPTFLKIAVDIRDNYAKLFDSISKYKVSSLLLGKTTRTALDEWDDLVEDLTIAGDPEIRDLIYKIAEVA